MVALGGNALIRAGQRGTLEEQGLNLDRSLLVAVELVRRGCGVIITHGNGPQVGHILLRAEAARGQAYHLTLDVCVAQSQGEMGYLIAVHLTNLLHDTGIERDVVTAVTRTLVDRHDPRLAEPTKPVGPFLTAEQAELLQGQGTHVIEDAHRGWRRVVPSPWPLGVVETGAIGRLVDAGVVVIAAGGGGIPVCEDADGRVTGVEAVVDKDFTGAVLATSLGARRILDLTSVERAKLSFGSPGERDIERMTVSEARRYLAEGHFAPGSMQPKIEAAVWFIEHGGAEFVLTTPEQAIDALDGVAGTRIVAG
jgi:carbamate kinase